MILGLGFDLLEVSRVERELSREQWEPENGVFTAGEVGYCRSGAKPAHRYAACIAAKEATLKALGVRVSDLAMFREVEVGLDPDRGYKVILHDRLKVESERLGVRSIRLSIAHNANHTGAMVILEA